MKNLFTLFSIAVVLFSCSSDDVVSTETSNHVAPDPTKLQKAILKPGATDEMHWFFNSDGLLDKVAKPDGTITNSYEYDSQQNLVTIHTFTGTTPATYNFTYDSNNRLTSYYGHAITYEEQTNSYALTYSYPELLIHYKLFLNNENIYRWTQETYAPETEVAEENQYDYYLYADAYNFSGGNITTITPGGYNHMSTGLFFTFDNKQNPFKQALLPILKVSFFGTNYYSDIFETSPKINAFFASNNNPITYQPTTGYEDDEGIGPQIFPIQYLYNELNFPKQMTLIFGNENRILAKYYYQGEQIPQ